MTPDWPAILLEDDSDATLLVWSDYLEEQGDEAARGVRELLVEKKRRPHRDVIQGSPSFCWGWTDKPYTFERVPDALDPATYNAINDHADGTDNFKWYDVFGEISTEALAHHLALLSAARAYLLAVAKPVTVP